MAYASCVRSADYRRGAEKSIMRSTYYESPDSEYMERCADCGTDHYRGDECEYCYERVTRYELKKGNKVLYRGYDQEAYDAAFDAAQARGEYGHKFNVTENVLINRRESHPYEEGS